MIFLQLIAHNYCKCLIVKSYLYARTLSDVILLSIYLTSVSTLSVTDISTIAITVNWTGPNNEDGIYVTYTTFSQTHLFLIYHQLM